MDDIEFFMLLLHLLTITTLYLTKKRKRRYAVRPINRSRDEKGMYNNLLKSMLLQDHDSFFNYTRMSPSVFKKLLHLVGPHLQKDTTKKSLPPSHRLLITIHYLAEGCSMREIAWGHMVGHSTVCKIIGETTQVLWQVLSPKVLQVPSVRGWEAIANGFYKRWNIPNCLGAIDGKHVQIQAPKYSGSTYFNYKKHHSIVLMASCDAFYRFTLVDIGASGANHDSAIFKHSGFGQTIMQNRLALPLAKELPHTSLKLPYFFTADAAFPLTERIMRPYPGDNLTIDKRIFNYRHSRARRTIENTFGILAQRWRILRKPIIANIDTCEKIVLAVVVLHNFVQKSEHELPIAQRRYCPTGFVDQDLPNGEVVPGNWRHQSRTLRSVGRLGSNNPAATAKDNRDNLCQFFNSKYGCVPWQTDHVLKGSVPDNF